MPAAVSEKETRVTPRGAAQMVEKARWAAAAYAAYPRAAVLAIVGAVAAAGGGRAPPPGP